MPPALRESQLLLIYVLAFAVKPSADSGATAAKSYHFPLAAKALEI